MDSKQFNQKAALFAFNMRLRKFGIITAEVGVSILNLPNGDDFVLMTDTGRYDSVARVSHEVATKVMHRTGLDPEATRWGEHYPGSEQQIILVDYIWEQRTNTYTAARWSSAPEWMVRYILDRISKPVPYHLNKN